MVRLCGRVLCPGDPVPQRLSVHDIKEEEGDKQKEVLEAKDDEEMDSEVDGEIGERETDQLNVCMRQWRWRWDEQGTNFSHNGCTRNQRTRKTATTETLQTNKLSALTILQLFSWVLTWFKFAALRIRVITPVVISAPTYSLFTCMWIPCNCSHCENGSFEVLSSHVQTWSASTFSSASLSWCKRLTDTVTQLENRSFILSLVLSHRSLERFRFPEHPTRKIALKSLPVLTNNF